MNPAFGVRAALRTPAVCGLFHLAGVACPVASALSVRSAGHDAAPGTVLSGRFEVEAGLLSSLEDPLLPDLIAAFSEGDEHYVVMPFLRGRTLTELVKQSGPLGLYDALFYTRALIGLLIQVQPCTTC